jgi:hypothetical protein
MTVCDIDRMTVQIAVRLDDALAEDVRAAAAATGISLSDWVRTAIRRQVALATALQARAEEDARPALYGQEQEDALVVSRRRRAVAAFDQQ